MLKLRQGIITMFMLLLAVSACKHPESHVLTNDLEKPAESVDSQPEIKFAGLVHNFGKVTEGEKVGWYFEFRNTGHSNLIINSATASCGCTIPEYERAPVPPGGKGTIKVVFDTSGREGKQIKTVSVESNARTLLTRLTLEAEVLKK